MSSLIYIIIIVITVFVALYLLIKSVFQAEYIRRLEEDKAFAWETIEDLQHRLIDNGLDGGIR